MEPIKRKFVSLTILSLLLLSTLMVVFIPKAESGEFEAEDAFEGTIEPQVVSGAYPYPTETFTFNITFLAETDKVTITLPSACSFSSAYSENNTIEWAVDTIEDDVFSVVFYNDTDSVEEGWDVFYITVVIGTSGSTTLTWTIETSLGESSLGSDTVDVALTPWFDAIISPVVVKSGQLKWFDIVITNNASTAAIYKVNITYPDTGWVYGNVQAPPYWVIDEHNTAEKYIVFRATGGYAIDPDESATFKFYMTTGTTNGNWIIECTNTAAVTANLTLTVAVDNTAPSITITSPSDGARVRGNVWINATVSDPHLQGWSLKINGTVVATGTTGTVSYLWNTLTYTDGVYIINVTATDAVGNARSVTRTVTVDNTAPQLLSIIVKAYQDGSELGDFTPIGNTIWIPNATSIQVNATFLDASGSLSGSIYFNVTSYPFSNNSWLPTSPYSIASVTSIPVKINITDSVGNRFVQTWYVRKDFNPPSAPTYTRYQLICGGIIIWGINATDAESTIVGYNIYINSSAEYITTSQLASTEWLSVSTHLYSFSGTVVVGLTGANYVNITITAVDGAGNERPTTVYVGTIPDGTWYPLELYPGWNLISLPLVPNSTARADIYALILKQGAAGVTFTYGFDNQAKQWTLNPTTITHGKGYWLHLNAYDVLIVQGTPIEEYWGLEPIYYLLYTGWNLAGYTEMDEYGADWYLSSLQAGTYFRYIFTWDAQNQRWTMIDTDGESPGNLTPGQGSWILLYEDQTLVPPIP